MPNAGSARGEGPEPGHRGALGRLARDAGRHRAVPPRRPRCPSATPRALSYYAQSAQAPGSAQVTSTDRGLRGSLNGGVVQTLGGAWSARLDLNLVSDAALVKDTTTDVTQQANQYLRSSLQVTRRTAGQPPHLPGHRAAGHRLGRLLDPREQHLALPAGRAGSAPGQLAAAGPEPCLSLRRAEPGAVASGSGDAAEPPDHPARPAVASADRAPELELLRRLHPAGPVPGPLGGRGRGRALQDQHLPGLAAAGPGDCSGDLHRVSWHATWTTSPRATARGRPASARRGSGSTWFRASPGTSRWATGCVSGRASGSARTSTSARSTPRPTSAATQSPTCSCPARCPAPSTTGSATPSSRACSSATSPASGARFPGFSPPHPTSRWRTASTTRSTAPSSRRRSTRAWLRLGQTLSRRTGAVMQELLRLDLAQEFDFETRTTGSPTPWCRLRGGYAPFNAGLTLRYDNQRHAPGLWAVYAGYATPRFSTTIRFDQLFVPVQFFDRDVGVYPNAQNLTGAGDQRRRPRALRRGREHAAGHRPLVGSPGPRRTSGSGSARAPSPSTPG